MTQSEALQAVRTATHDYVTAVETDALDDDEMDWLAWLQGLTAKRALDLGCRPEAIKAALIKGVEEAQACSA